MNGAKKIWDNPSAFRANHKKASIAGGFFDCLPIDQAGDCPHLASNYGVVVVAGGVAGATGAAGGVSVVAAGGVAAGGVSVVAAGGVVTGASAAGAIGVVSVTEGVVGAGV
jgi:hypothetical protein